MTGLAVKLKLKHLVHARTYVGEPLSPSQKQNPHLTFDNEFNHDISVVEG